MVSPSECLSKASCTKNRKKDRGKRTGLRDQEETTDEEADGDSSSLRLLSQTEETSEASTTEDTMGEEGEGCAGVSASSEEGESEEDERQNKKKNKDTKSAKDRKAEREGLLKRLRVKEESFLPESDRPPCREITVACLVGELSISKPNPTKRGPWFPSSSFATSLSQGSSSLFPFQSSPTSLMNLPSLPSVFPASSSLPPPSPDVIVCTPGKFTELVGHELSRHRDLEGTRSGGGGWMGNHSSGTPGFLVLLRPFFLSQRKTDSPLTAVYVHMYVCMYVYMPQGKGRRRSYAVEYVCLVHV